MTTRAIIREGDPTSHGGTVLEGFASLSFYGRKAAGIGHRGYCPLCKQDFLIVEGAPNRRHMGRALAVEGMLTSCGATLIATQNDARIEVASGAVAGGSTGIASFHAAAPNANALAPEFEYYFTAQFEDGSSADLSYRIDADGEKLCEGALDAHGSTQVLPFGKRGEPTFWVASQ